MKRLLAPILLLTLLFPSLAMGGEVKFDDLVKRGGIYYKKFSDAPFTGKITGHIQGSFKNGKSHGPWVFHHDNGQLMDKGNYKDGKEDGPWVNYHDSGQLFYKGNYKEGKKDGPWVMYNADGTIWHNLTGTYKNGVKVK